MLHRRPAASRFAAAFLLLSVITVATVCLGLALAIGFQPDSMPRSWSRISLYYWTLISLGSAIYTFLVIEARLLLPLGIPSLLAFAALFARVRR